MPYSQEKIDAMAKLDAAIEDCIKAFDSLDGSALLTGYTVIICATRFLDKDLDEECYEETDDDIEQVSNYAAFTKRGQPPVITRGMVEGYLDRWRNVQS